MVIRRGLIYVLDQVLAVQPNVVAPSRISTPLSLRGPGYRMRSNTLFAPLDTATGAVTSEEICESVSKFYDTVQTVPTAVTFGGGFSEPLVGHGTTLQAIRSIKEDRHGLRCVVQTLGNGVMGAVPELVELDSDLRTMPGSDGDSKLEVWVDVTEGVPECAGLIATLVEGGVKVNATASEKVSKAKVKEAFNIASSLGASQCFLRSYHEESLYDILGCDSGDDFDTLRASYLAQVKAEHPDVREGGDDGGNRIAMITEAWETLKDAEKRRAYDHDFVADLALNAQETDFFQDSNTKMA